jgi:hypothetical protein
MSFWSVIGSFLLASTLIKELNRSFKTKTSFLSILYSVGVRLPTGITGAFVPFSVHHFFRVSPSDVFLRVI